jgi:hypothetical protein
LEALQACKRPGTRPGLTCVSMWSSPPESNRRPHPYHRWSARSGDNAAPRPALQNPKWLAVSTIEKWGAARRYAGRLLANHWHACRSFVGLAGPSSSHARQPPAVQRSWCEQSLQVRSGGSSSQSEKAGSAVPEWRGHGCRRSADLRALGLRLASVFGPKRRVPSGYRPRAVRWASRQLLSFPDRAWRCTHGLHGL